MPGLKPNCRPKRQAVQAEPAEITVDGFLGGRFDLMQPAKGHRAGLDAALLQAMIPASATGYLVDLGTGTGVVALSAASRAPALQVIGVEIDPVLTALAEDSRHLPKNRHFADRVRFLTADATAARQQRETAGLIDGTADWVTMNPPFECAGRVRLSPDERRRQAHVGNGETLQAWTRTASGLLAAGGKLAVVHRADALQDLFDAMRGRFGGVCVHPVHPHENEPAIRILLSATKGSKAPLEIRRGLVLHGKDGDWTPLVQEILNGRRTLE